MDFKTFYYKIYNIWNVKQTIIDFESDLKDSECSSSYVTELINHLETVFFLQKKLQNNSYRDCWEIGNLSIKAKIRETTTPTKVKCTKKCLLASDLHTKTFMLKWENISSPTRFQDFFCGQERHLCVKKDEPFFKTHLLINCPASMLTKILVCCC